MKDEIEIALFDEGGSYWSLDFYTRRLHPTHWMELPKPPVRKDDG